MRDVLVVVDMQNDFITDSLGTAEAVAIVPAVKEKIEGFSGRVIFTRDTHGEDYLSSREGGMLPIEHCIRGTKGWEICGELAPFAEEIVDKPTFTSPELGEMLVKMDQEEGIGEITVIGLCTDVCVISISMTLRGFLPETPIHVTERCCAGVTPEGHKTALAAMANAQVLID